MNQRLRAKRQKRGWTTSEVVQRLGVEPHKYVQWERDWSEPTDQQIRQLCQLFGCEPLDIGYMIPEEDNAKATPN